MIRKIALYLFGAFFIVSLSNANELHPKAKYINDLQLNVFSKVGKKGIGDSEVRQIVVDHYMKYIDFEWNARMALGRAWKQFSPSEQTEYVKAYTIFLAYTWLPKLTYSANSSVKVKVKAQVVSINDNDDNVFVNVTTLDGKVYDVILRVRDVGHGEYKILNITVEGIDLAMSYRTQFEQYIEKNGGVPQNLLQYIKEKNEQNKRNVDFVVRL